jgi:hypothetical protein
VFALTSGNGTNSHSFASGANFVIQKPLSPEHALRSLRAAHGLMLREHRRYIRCRIHLPCLIFHATGNVRAETFDISESGVGVHLPASAVERLAGAALRLQISLPGESIDLESAVQIAWAKPGRAGLRFTAMSTRCKNTLLGWLSRTLEG